MNVNNNPQWLSVGLIVVVGFILGVIMLSAEWGVIVKEEIEK
jgi:ElaB/YqjD/DUF883 family membrane-anchored ribosome-binding protein